MVERHEEHKAGVLQSQVRELGWQFCSEGKDSKRGGIELMGVHDKLCEERKWNLCVVYLTHIYS